MNKNNYLQQFIIGVLGTALGVALTFGLNGIQERRQQAKAQRLTAIMVIHDIDGTIDLLKNWKQQEEEADKLLSYALKHQDKLGEMPYDTLSKTINLLVAKGSDFHFDTSKEKIFNSDVDTWQNIGNMKFIDNVQSFFYGRQSFQDDLNNSVTWKEPISREQYMQIFMENGWITQNQFLELGEAFLKEQLQNSNVSFYIEVSNHRLQYLDYYINAWTRLNEENKFLIGITDQELEDYINHIEKEGEAVKKRTLKGTWIYSTENVNQKYSFVTDNSFTSEARIKSKNHWLNFSGEFIGILKYNGSWEMKGDSLILISNPQSFEFNVDGSGLVAAEGKQDSLDTWLKKFPEETLKSNREMTEEEARVAYKARLDPSRDKMEWTDKEGNERYLKRE